MSRLRSALLQRLAAATMAQYAGILLLSRLLLLVVIHLVTHDHEVSNDAFMHMGMIRDPFSILLYTVPQFEQHPPFLPFVETVLGYPLQMLFSDFLAIRLLMIVWETVLACLFVALLAACGITGSRRGWCLAAFLLLPNGWMTSTVMAQDDCIAACGVLLPLVLYLGGHRRAALLLSGIGVVAAKLFVLLELFVLLPLSRQRDRWMDACIGFGPVVVVYGLLSVARLSHHQPLPLIGFKPNQYFGTNFWIVLHRYAHLEFPPIATYIGILALLSSFIPVFLLTRIPTPVRRPTDVCAALGTSLLFFFSLFYHVGPEYFIILTPALIVSSVNKTDAVYLSLMSVVPWAGKLFQNAAFMYRAGESSGKGVAKQLFERVFHSSPETWLWIDQVLFSILTLYMCYHWSQKLWRRAGTIA